MRLLSSILSVLALGLLARAYPNPGTVTGNTASHDPSMCKDSSGKYFVFCKYIPRIVKLTPIECDYAATAPGIEIRTSTDRTAWTLTGLVFPNGAATWTDAYTGTSNGWVSYFLFL